MLRATMVDLLHDMGPSEHFLVDGESLALEAVAAHRADPAVPLTCLWAAERLLAALQRYRTPFTLVFFEDYEALWRQAGRPDLLLARETLVRHLDLAGLPMELFPSWRHQQQQQQQQAASSFGAYLSSRRPVFMLLSDLAAFAAPDEPDGGPQRARRRAGLSGELQRALRPVALACGGLALRCLAHQVDCAQMSALAFDPITVSCWDPWGWGKEWDAWHERIRSDAAARPPPPPPPPPPPQHAAACTTHTPVQVWAFLTSAVKSTRVVMQLEAAGALRAAELLLTQAHGALQHPHPSSAPSPATTLASTVVQLHSWRLGLGVHSAAHLLLARPPPAAAGAEGQVGTRAWLCASWLLHQALLRALTLRQRAIRGDLLPLDEPGWCAAAPVEEEEEDPEGGQVVRHFATRVLGATWRVMTQQAPDALASLLHGAVLPAAGPEGDAAAAQEAEAAALRAHASLCRLVRGEAADPLDLRLWRVLLMHLCAPPGPVGAPTPLPDAVAREWRGACAHLARLLPASSSAGLQQLLGQQSGAAVVDPLALLAQHAPARVREEVQAWCGPQAWRDLQLLTSSAAGEPGAPHLQLPTGPATSTSGPEALDPAGLRLVRGDTFVHKALTSMLLPELDGDGALQATVLHAAGAAAAAASSSLGGGDKQHVGAGGVPSALLPLFTSRQPFRDRFHFHSLKRLEPAILEEVRGGVMSGRVAGGSALPPLQRQAGTRPHVLLPHDLCGGAVARRRGGAAPAAVRGQDHEHRAPALTPVSHPGARASHPHHAASSLRTSTLGPTLSDGGARVRPAGRCPPTSAARWAPSWTTPPCATRTRASWRASSPSPRWSSASPARCAARLLPFCTRQRAPWRCAPASRPLPAPSLGPPPSWHPPAGQQERSRL